MEMALSFSPPLPMTMGLWLSRSTRMVAKMRRRLPSSSNLSMVDGYRIGDFIAAQAEHFFANQFGGQLAFGLVGDIVLVEQRRVFRQMGLQGFQQFVQVAALLG